MPKLQQAWVDYLADPKPTADALIEITKAYNNYWTIDADLNAAGFELFTSLGIGGNGPDSTYGNFDMDRVQKLFDEAKPLLTELGVDVDPELTVDGVVTNQFIDESVGVAG